MREITLGSVILTLADEEQGIRVKSARENVMLPDQTIEAASRIVVENFWIVRSFYASRMSGYSNAFDRVDLDVVSIAIVLHYLYMYNMWRKLYKEHTHIDLRFNEEDFDTPAANDIILDFFKKRYPKAWEENCAILMKMNLQGLREYHKGRQTYHDR